MFKLFFCIILILFGFIRSEVQINDQLVGSYSSIVMDTIITEEKSQISKLEKEYSMSVNIDSVYLKFNSSLSDIDRLLLIKSVCYSMCGEEVTMTIVTSIKIGVHNYYRIKKKYKNEWWRNFFGGYYYEGIVLKYSKINKDDSLLIIHKSSGNDKLILHKVVEKMGTVVNNSIGAVKNVTNTIQNILWKMCYALLIILCLVISVNVYDFSLILKNILTRNKLKEN